MDSRQSTRYAFILLAAFGAQGLAAQVPSSTSTSTPLRIIAFGAHPDDAEYRGAGVAMKWAKLGHHVKLVSATNGDIGHWQIAGGPLALRRQGVRCSG